MLTVRVGSDQNYEELLLDSHLFSFVAYHLLILLLHELADRVISLHDTRDTREKAWWLY